MIMSLINKTRKTIVAEKIRFCKNNLTKTIGLMFHKKLKNKALVFIFKREKIIPIHMLFVFYPIDVLFLDGNKKIVEIKENLKPFTFYMPKNKAKYILELPCGTVKKTKTTMGDAITLI